MTDFKLLALNTLKFAAILLLVELCFGSIVESLYFSQNTGKQARIISSLQDNARELIILGSSHANRHYVPRVFNERLGYKTYNAGVLGQKVLFTSALQKMILKNQNPKVMVVNIDEGWMFESRDAYDRLSDLHPFYWDYRSILLPVLSLGSSWVDVKMMSKAYRFNSTLVHFLVYLVKPQKDDDGHRPSYAKLDTTEYLIEDETGDYDQYPELDTNFIAAFTDIIHSASSHNVKLFFVISPIYQFEATVENESMAVMLDIIKEEGIPLFDFRGDTAFLHKHELFFDRSHLNHDGALVLSEKVATRLRDYDEFDGISKHQEPSEKPL